MNILTRIYSRPHIFFGILTLLFASLIFLVKPFHVAAQDAEEPQKTEFEKTRDDYQLKLADYQTAHANYVLKKTQYMRFKTLQSQQEAQEATVKLLQTRDDVVISYLTMLLAKLNEAEGVDDTAKSNLTVRINSEINYYQEHKGKIPSAGTLKDLEEDSKKAQQRWRYVEPLSYEVLATVSSGRIVDFEERLRDLFTQLNEKIEKIKTEDSEEKRLSDRQINQLDRWVLETENRILRTDEKQLEAQKEIDNLTVAANRNFIPLTLYNTAILRLNEAKQFLKEGGTFMIEIVREIKTKDE